MQRAASSSATKPSSLEDECHSAKRRKTNDDLTVSRANKDLQIVEAAVDEHEVRRVRAMERLAEEAGETKWELSTTNRRKVHGDTTAAQSIMDCALSRSEPSSTEPAAFGRRTFGKHNRKGQVCAIWRACVSDLPLISSFTYLAAC